MSGAGHTMRSRIEPMKKIARSLRQHRELILNYFRAQKLLSSGVVEGLNNKAKVTMRKSYGFRTHRVLELALYHSLGKLPEPGIHPRFLLTSQMFKADLDQTDCCRRKTKIPARTARPHRIDCLIEVPSAMLGNLCR
jgi:hypothetical protein